MSSWSSPCRDSTRCDTLAGQALNSSLLAGLVEPLAAALGFHLVSAVRGLVPFGLALAAGAMVFVASDHFIPETRFDPRAKSPSLALLAGFLLVAILVQSIL